MGDRSRIEWTDATWNPVVGCTKVSPGCDHCYAERITNRFGGPGAFDTVTLAPERLDQPLRWRRPRRVFVNSMSDLFHADIPDEYVAEVFAVMALAPRHTFQVLTKRHGRMRSLLSSEVFRAGVVDAVLDLLGGATEPAHLYPLELRERWWPLPNVWLGVSVEDQQWADIRVPALLDTPAAVRFLSCEPLLGPVELDSDWLDGPRDCACDDPAGCRSVDWVIVGGESGPQARPMHPDWARSLRDQCLAARVPFHFKQWGEWAPSGAVGIGGTDPRRMFVAPAVDEHGCGVELARVGKRAAGRELDGRTWDEYPEVSGAVRA